MFEAKKLINLPTPTLMVTDAGVLAIAPELIKSYGHVFRAVRLGMDLDDFWDFGVNERPVGDSESKVFDADPVEFYERYFESYGKFIDGAEQLSSEDRIRLINNAGWFISSINYLEGTAVSQSKKYWSPETVTQYRESVALVWAMFLSSLLVDSQLDLYQIGNPDETLSIESCFDWLNQQDSELTENLYARRMYYGALVFQVVSDYGKRQYARDQFIPSFGGIGFEELTEEELASFVHEKTIEYYEGAVKNGTSPKALSLFLNVFPQIQRILNRTKKSNAVSHWAYS